MNPDFILFRYPFFDPVFGPVENIQFELQSELLRLFLLFKGVKSLYFTYSIVNFTVLNLQGITSLHLLTTRVGLLLLLKSVRLFLQTTRVA